MSGEMDTKAAIEAGRKIGELSALGAVFRVEAGREPFLLMPVGYTKVSLAEQLAVPTDLRARVVLEDAASFVAYVKRFGDPDSVVFADLQARKFEAVIDYHQRPLAGGAQVGDAVARPAAPRWGRHRALFECATTSVWDEWTDEGWDRKPKSQLEFARFVEEHVPHIAEPSGAVLFELCSTLEAKKDVAFRSSTRLSDGQHQFRYEETITGQAGSVAGLVSVPDKFTIGIEPIAGVGKRRVDARLRYRINQGALSMWYELVRPDDVLEAAFQDLVAGIRTGLGDVPVLSGKAPASA